MTLLLMLNHLIATGCSKSEFAQPIATISELEVSFTPELLLGVMKSMLILHTALRIQVLSCIYCYSNPLGKPKIKTALSQFFITTHTLFSPLCSESQNTTQTQIISVTGTNYNFANLQ